jgi:hypothetical protein
MTWLRRRWVRRLLFVLILAGAVYLARGPLLRGLASFLIVEDSGQEVDALVPLDGDHLYETTGLLVRNDVSRRVLLLQTPPDRLERMGVMPDPITVARRELASDNVPESAVEVIRAAKGGDWNRARALRDWLKEHPDARVCVLCDRFASRRTRYVFDQKLGGAAAQVQWRALPDRRYDERNWYDSKVGVLALFDSYLSLTQVWLYGDALGDRDEWDPDKYQSDLR